MLIVADPVESKMADCVRKDRRRAGRRGRPVGIELILGGAGRAAGAAPDEALRLR